jgi:hypothetical protein
MEKTSDTIFDPDITKTPIGQRLSLLCRTMCGAMDHWSVPISHLMTCKLLKTLLKSPMGPAPLEELKMALSLHANGQRAFRVWSSLGGCRKMG